MRTDLLTEMKNSTYSSHVAYTNFTRVYSKDKQGCVYCFFEGKEDNKYYGNRITIKYQREFEHFPCGGRDFVLKLKNLIKNIPEYEKAKVLFFVDKDYSEDTMKDNLYVTPCYSIENFYSSKETLIRILQNEFNMDKLDEDFSIVLNLYDKLSESYHQKLLFLNAWLSCQYDFRVNIKTSTRLNINEVLKDYFKSNDNMFDVDLNLRLNIFNDLENNEILENNLFANAPKISKKEIDDKINYFKKTNKSYTFRGKFELKFFIDFLKRLKEEATSKKQKILIKKYKCDLSFKLEDSISVLSQYSNTPNCLIEFFDEQLKIS
ncbi:DUF4435 domain-containing protein [Aliarcobacter butzleri]